MDFGPSSEFLYIIVAWERTKPCALALVRKFLYLLLNSPAFHLPSQVSHLSPLAFKFSETTCNLQHWEVRCEQGVILFLFLLWQRSSRKTLQNNWALLVRFSSSFQTPHLLPNVLHVTPNYYHSLYPKSC